MGSTKSRSPHQHVIMYTCQTWDYSDFFGLRVFVTVKYVITAYFPSYLIIAKAVWFNQFMGGNNTVLESIMFIVGQKGPEYCGALFVRFDWILLI